MPSIKFRDARDATREAGFAWVEGGGGLGGEDGGDGWTLGDARDAAGVAGLGADGGGGGQASRSGAVKFGGREGDEACSAVLKFGGAGRVHHLVDLPATDLGRHVRPVFVVWTGWRFICCYGGRFGVDRGAAKPEVDPAAVVHCSCFALRSGAAYAKDLAAAVEHDCYYETGHEDESEDDAEDGGEEFGCAG